MILSRCVLFINSSIRFLYFPHFLSINLFLLNLRVSILNSSFFESWNSDGRLVMIILRFFSFLSFLSALNMFFLWFLSDPTSSKASITMIVWGLLISPIFSNSSSSISLIPFLFQSEPSKNTTFLYGYSDIIFLTRLVAQRDLPDPTMAERIYEFEDWIMVLKLIFIFCSSFLIRVFCLIIASIFLDLISLSSDLDSISSAFWYTSWLFFKL